MGRVFRLELQEADASSTGLKQQLAHEQEIGDSVPDGRQLCEPNMVPTCVLNRKGLTKLGLSFVFKYSKT
jgi:hypothetical protein